MDKETKEMKEKEKDPRRPSDISATNDDSDFFSDFYSTSANTFGSDIGKRETLELLGEL